MRCGMRAAAGLIAAGVVLVACETADANLTPEERSVREAAYDCAASEYDRIFFSAGRDSGQYDPDDRNVVTGLLRDRASAGQGADADSERRVRNILGDSYGRLFLDAYEACMMSNT